jgi:hypothetical protein
MDTNDLARWVLCCDGYHFFKKLLAARPSAISSCPTDTGLVGLFWCREMPQSHTEHAPEWYHHSVSSFCLSEVFFPCSTSDLSATISTLCEDVLQWVSALSHLGLLLACVFLLITGCPVLWWHYEKDITSLWQKGGNCIMFKHTTIKHSETH